MLECGTVLREIILLFFLSLILFKKIYFCIIFFMILSSFFNVDRLLNMIWKYHNSCLKVWKLLNIIVKSSAFVWLVSRLIFKVGGNGVREREREREFAFASVADFVSLYGIFCSPISRVKMCDCVLVCVMPWRSGSETLCFY